MKKNSKKKNEEKQKCQKQLHPISKTYAMNMNVN